ncbi:LuxR C-terminal-related transcriptional regulator [Ketobacter alkanivorans]|uniref:HTH luxR-type domain-containing protein n=1 Tax=Ketobacter alkanivorans TaxID=1917421 RepID=A0A2K9LJ07_9GAMM|nr:LuxR C-terminal-related transcriptional regulator [Ketobacter alkanivorans]AUM12262.1 hypothetical protein Kalk_07485 [Ketobacter alkanivorans]
MLLKTKFFAPPIRDDAIPRERLLRRLGSPAPGRLSLIHAPAGYGKTTLIKQWLDSLRGHYSWLSLDQQDNEPSRFWQYLSSALALPMPRAERDTAINEDHLIRLLNHWQAAAPDFLHVLVLDDFHCIQDQAILDQLSWFLDRLPHSLHLVITSRTLPQLHIPRRRVRNTVVELKAQDLCFQSTETQQFLEQTLSLHLKPDMVSALHNQTEGWAAALQLAGLYLQGDEASADQWLERKSNNSMVDYLAEEVLASQTEAVQQFLLHVTLMRRFNLPLCEFALSDLPDCEARACLLQLQENNLFLIPLDEDSNWFRFHDLFRENIQSLARKAIPDSLRIFLRNAANWFLANAEKEEAIFCLMQAELWHDAANLIEELGVTRMLAGQNDSLNWWLNRLPETTIAERPKLALIKAWTLFCTERVIEAEPYLDQADRMLQGADHTALHTQILLFRAHIARFRGDTEQSAHWSALAMQQSQDTPHQHNAVTQFAMGLELYQNGQHQSARVTLEQALKAAHEELNYFCALSVSVLLSHVYFHAGFTQQALAILEDTRHWLMNQQQAGDYIEHWQNILYVSIYRETRKLDQARQFMQPLLELQQQGVENGHSALISLIQSALHACDRNWDLALTATEFAAGLMAQDQSHWSAMSPDASMMRAVYYLQKANPEPALQWAKNNEKRLLENQHFNTEEERMVLARCLSLQGRSDEALQLLESIIEESTCQGRQLNKARSLLTQAIVYCHHGRLDAATDALQLALSCAEPAGLQQMFFDESPFIQPALLLLKQRGHTGWWETVIDYATDEPNEQMVEPLTSRELEVLNLIAIGHRNQAIADTLHIALTTTKAHIRNIYEKMSVASRTQAVARGRELGLIH